MEELKRNIEKLHRTEIIQNPLELFKTLVIKKLRGEDTRLTTAESSDGKAVYIIHQKSDENGAGKLAKSITGEGVNVGMLNFSGPRENLLRDHKKYLRSCDAVLIYYESQNRPWLRAKVMDLQKAPGYGRTKTLKGKHLLSAGKDKLDDFSIPGEISMEMETDQGKTLTILLKHLQIKRVKECLCAAQWENGTGAADIRTLDDQGLACDAFSGPDFVAAVYRTPIRYVLLAYRLSAGEFLPGTGSCEDVLTLDRGGIRESTTIEREILPGDLIACRRYLSNLGCDFGD